MIADHEWLISSKSVLTLPNDRLLPFPPIATEDICLRWLLEIISPHNQMPSIFPLTTIVSPQMLDFFQGKGEVGVRNVIPKRIFPPKDKRKEKIRSMKCISKTAIAYDISLHWSWTLICCSNRVSHVPKKKKKKKTQRLDTTFFLF